MQTKQIGTTEIEGSVLVLGTWAIGGSEWGGTDENASIEAIHAAIDEGINFIDTAPIYGQGLAEELVGRAIEGRREQLCIATKVGMRWDIEEGQFAFENGDIRIYRNLKPVRIREEVERSLHRLRTDRIDLLQTHWPDNTTEVEETMSELLKLKEEGKILAIGACNVDAELFRRYETVTSLDSIQEKFSMIDREIEAELAPLAHTSGASVLAYSPLAMGMLTGKVSTGRKFEADDVRSWSPRFTVENRQRVNSFLSSISPMAESYGVTIAQLVIAWTIAQQTVTHVLCGARNRAQALENAKAGQLELRDNDLEMLNRLLEAANLDLPHPFQS
ncbi:MAG: aldo/keto reductase [Verrucomicrobiota bacterium]